MARDGSDDLSGDDESNLLDPLAEDDMKINLLPPQEPEDKRFSLRRLLLLLGVVVILAGGGYLAYTLFLDSPPPPPSGPPPIARAPVPAKPPAPAIPAPPAPGQAAAPGGSAAPAPAAKLAQPETPSDLAKAPAPKAPEPAAVGPVAKAPAAPPPPAKLPEAKAPAASRAQVAPPPAAAPKAPVKTAKAPAPAPGSFSLQVGAYAVQANAEGLKKRLEASGFASTVRKGSAHLNRHVVTVGEPTTRREAEETARRLNIDGFPSDLVSVGGKYTPQLGAFLSQDEAIDLAREVQQKQYVPKISQRALTTEVYQVRHGEFDSRAAALKRGEELRAKGFSEIFVVRK
jgi:cell division protein FtsN